ncbi:MAG: hypothetical protein IOD12_04500 [Silvanigrellales bacterium]|nr:hypothetical protein [Silvanigrellales bacterium]
MKLLPTVVLSVTAAVTLSSACVQKSSKSAAKATETMPAAQGDAMVLQGDVSECAKLALDPADKRDFVFNARLRTGKHKGECIKNDIHRPILPLDEADVVKHVPEWQSANPGDYALVANVSHIDPAQFDWSKPEESARQQFWFAKIPLGKVKDTYFQLEHFPSLSQQQVDGILAKVPNIFNLRGKGSQFFKVVNDHMAGHTQMRVEFNEDVELVSQFTGTKSTTRNLIFTVEAVGQNNYMFDIFGGLQPNFVAMHRVTTMELKFYDMMMAPEGGSRKYHIVEQVKLRLGDRSVEASEAAKQAVVPLFLHKSETNGVQIKHGDEHDYMQATYNTVGNNCTNAITRLIDTAVISTGAYTPWKRTVASAMAGVDFFPAIVHNGLENRGAMKRSAGRGSEVYTHVSMCEEESMKPMRERLFEFMRADAAAGKLPKDLVAGKCPELSTKRPGIVDLIWVGR